MRGRFHERAAKDTVAHANSNMCIQFNIANTGFHPLLLLLRPTNQLVLDP
jgi:hypothetical protein